MRRRIPCLLLGTAVLAGMVLGAAYAQDAVEVNAESFKNATRIKSVVPEYPRAELRRAKEGWVLVSYVVSTDGEVLEPMIEDTSGLEAFEEAALAAVRQWRFEPATMNGEPVEQSMMHTKIIFALDSGSAGAGARFRTQYAKIAELVDSGQLAEAEPLLVDLEFGGRANLYEDAWFWWLKYVYLEKTQADASEMLGALTRAVGYEQDYLDPNVFVVAAQRLYVLQLDRLMFSAARATFERLRDSSTARKSDLHEAVVAALTPSYDAINQVAASDRTLFVEAAIGDHDYWVHRLFRRSFALADVNGQVDVVDIRCERGTKRYTSFPIDSVWQVPEGWGDCGVYIKGEPGTTFRLEELAPGTAAAAARPAPDTAQ